MATKASLLSTLTTWITAIVTVSKHRSANQAMVDEFYKVPFASSDFMTISDTDFTCNLQCTKQGSVVHLYGNITNNSGSVKSNAVITNITNAEFNVFGSKNVQCPIVGGTGAFVVCQFTGSNTLQTVSFPASTTVYLDSYYFVED